jgi:hypothetical protein
LKKPVFNLRPEVVFSVVSLFISLLSLSFFVIQTHIMQSQQQASVWPFLKVSPHISDKGFHLEVYNNGIGPAIVESVEIEYKNKTYRTFEQVAKQIITDSTFNYYVYGVSAFEKEVIPAGGKIDIFNTAEMRFASRLAYGYNDVKINVVYISVYGKKWLRTETGVKEIN